MEIMVGFDTIERGLDKNGVGLSEKEKNAIQNFIFSESISANFVLKVAEENGFKSMLSSFLLDTEMDNISFLLHKYKGRYYRNYYPELSFNID